MRGALGTARVGTRLHRLPLVTRCSIKTHYCLTLNRMTMAFRVSQSHNGRERSKICAFSGRSRKVTYRVALDGFGSRDPEEKSSPSFRERSGRVSGYREYPGPRPGRHCGGRTLLASHLSGAPRRRHDGIRTRVPYALARVDLAGQEYLPEGSHLPSHASSLCSHGFPRIFTLDTRVS